MIKEQYVSFKVAKLLADKGFTEPCIAFYFSDGKLIISSKGIRDRNSSAVSTYSAPTQAMVMRWLREVHNLYVDITTFCCKHSHVISFGWKVIDDDHRMVGDSNITYKTYEKACEEAIKFCLTELITEE